ncbi:MAG: hypothetical protein WCV88_05710 [Patescibacteria group bacterium]|jgi:hypothetical protein
MRLDIINDYNFSDNEKMFVNEAGTGQTSDINQTRVTSTIILAKVIQKSSKEIIASNERLSVSNEKYTKAMLWLTFGLVITAIIQIIITAIRP